MRGNLEDDIAAGWTDRKISLMEVDDAFIY